MSKYTVAIVATYDLSGELYDEYIEWLEDQPDTEEGRQCFLVDKFTALDWAFGSNEELNRAYQESTVAGYIDPNARIIYKEIK